METTEKKISHTPGPWKVDDGPGCKLIKGGKMGAHKQAQYTGIAYTVGLANEDRDSANAKLIAAAPELLKSLQAIVAAGQLAIHAGDNAKHSFTEMAIMNALDAIKKATE